MKQRFFFASSMWRGFLEAYREDGKWRGGRRRSPWRGSEQYRVGPVEKRRRQRHYFVLEDGSYLHPPREEGRRNAAAAPPYPCQSIGAKIWNVRKTGAETEEGMNGGRYVCTMYAWLLLDVCMHVHGCMYVCMHAWVDVRSAHACMHVCTVIQTGTRIRRRTNLLNWQTTAWLSTLSCTLFRALIDNHGFAFLQSQNLAFYHDRKLSGLWEIQVTYH